MKNKVLVKLRVPEVDEEYDIYLPINKKIGNIIILLNKAINELTNDSFKISTTNTLYNSFTGERYKVDSLLLETNIRNGSNLILLS
jgi:hypothetical protein